MQYFRTFLDIIGKPEKFSRGLSRMHGYDAPALFVGITGFIGIAPAFLLFSGFHASDLALPLRLLLGAAMAVLYALLLPVLLLVRAAFVHLAMNIAGAVGDYQDTYRSLGFSYAPLVLIWIPFVNLVAAIWAFALSVIFLARVHELSALRVFITFLILGLILAIPAIIFIIYFIHTRLGALAL